MPPDPTLAAFNAWLIDRNTQLHDDLTAARRRWEAETAAIWVAYRAEVAEREKPVLDAAIVRPARGKGR